MDTKYLLALNCHPKIGGQTLKKMLAVYDSPESLWSDSQQGLLQKLGEKLTALVLEARSVYNPENEIEKLASFGVGYITIFDKGYPKLLNEAYDCPAILYIKGNAKILNNLSLGVVGSRKYTVYGKKLSYKLSKECAESGITIISGLALGVDAFAHQAALDANGKTVGVLGCGLDKIYPVSNFHLGQEIIEKGGAIISEFPLGVPPMKQNFPARNRIIAGLSAGVLVIEAAEKSGALITAYQALEYSREVFALPGDIDSENSIGTNKLIQEGAKLVLSVDDILKELNIEKKVSEQKVKEIVPKSADEQIIINLLSQKDCLIDELIKQSNLNIVAVNSTLTMLEMKGLVTNIGGGCYRLSR